MLQFLEKLKSLPALQALKKLRMNRGVALGLVCLLLALALLIRPGTRELPPERTEATGTAPVTEPPESTEPPEPSAPSGLVELEGLQVRPDESVSGLCLDGDGAAVFLTRWDDDAQVWHIRMVSLDPATASVTGEVALEPMGDSASYSMPVLTDTEIRFVDPDSERCAAFDRSGRFLGLKDHPVMDREHLGWRNRLIGDDSVYKTWRWAEFSHDDGGRLSRMVAFYDEKDCVHLVGEPYDLIRDVNGHRMLTLRYGEDAAGELALLDLDASVCLDRLELDPDESVDCLLGPDWVLLDRSRIGDGNSEHRICFWYPEEGRQSPIETELLTEQAITDEIGFLCRQLEAQGIILHLDEAPATELTPTTGLSVLENNCETGASLFGQYWVLTELAAFAEKLPEGMIRELTAEPGSDPADAESLEIYIVRRIPGDAAAFANGWSSPAMICFATEEFNRTHLAHEFMHVIDLRLTRYLQSQRRDMEREWMALSPDWAYEPDLSQEQSDELEACFVSWYARTNSAEDRAESFQALFDSEEPVAEQWWCVNKPGVLAKVRWLADNIRAAFPSVQAVEKAWWEKLPAEPEPE